MTEYVYPFKGRPILARKDHVCWACEGQIDRGEMYSREQHITVVQGRITDAYLKMHIYCRHIVDTYGYLFREQDTNLVRPFKYWGETHGAKKRDLPVQLKDFLTIVMDFDI